MKLLQHSLQLFGDGQTEIMYCADETSKEVLWTDLEYMVEALTIPILENSDMTDDEIYALLKLPEDVSQCSKDLITRYIVK